MVHSISQETFDSTVKENMDEFGLSVDEAIQDTIKEYKAQGADLSQVIVDLMASNIDPKALTDAIEALKNHLRDVKTPNEYIPQLMRIRKECDRGIQYKIIAGKEGAYTVIIDALEKNLQYNEMIIECLKTLTVLMNKNPDLLDQRGINNIMAIVDKQKSEEVLILLLKWVKECCVLHEENRQSIFNAGILDHLKPLLDGASSEVLCAIMGVLRALVLDDDIRVEFGKAHEHARIIASDTLCAITALLEKFKTDEAVMNELILTLSALLVRTEFCKKVEDAGGLAIIQGAMIEFHDSEKVTRQCFKVLKALAGNDDCKGRIIKNGCAPIIVSLLTKHQNSSQTAVVGLACMAALTLRSVENSQALFESGAPKVIVNIMTSYPENESIQKNASWAIRNMVSRSRNQNKEFLNLGVEALLLTALKKYKKIEYDVKAALRDLECDVDLKEEWTGKGGKLQTEEKTSPKQ